MADETPPPLSGERLAEIRELLSDEEGMRDIEYRLTSAWASVRFSGEVKLAARELLAEVDRLLAQTPQ